MRIYLIGFMGTGKSTLGQYVADKWRVPFIDTDIVIESQTGMSIDGIFETRGEKEFRELEADVIRQTTIYEKALIATGGGLPCYFENMQWMNDHGITMHLSWKKEILMSNLIPQTSSRPLLKDLNIQEAEMKIEMMLEERMPYYEMSAITIEMSGDIENDILLLDKACKYIW
ncbi:MAG: shikimate kinase [Saprospiraceae bacterium]